MKKFLKRLAPFAAVLALAVGGVAGSAVAATGDYQTCTFDPQNGGQCGTAVATSLADVRGTHSWSSFSFEFTAYYSTGIKLGGPYGPWNRSGYHYGTPITVPSGTAYIVYDQVWNYDLYASDTFWTCKGTSCTG